MGGGRLRKISINNQREIKMRGTIRTRFFKGIIEI